MTLIAAGGANAQSAGQIMRHEADRLAGRIEESVASFDQVARARPGAAPQFWQRGMALYYVRRYDDCRRQFEGTASSAPTTSRMPRGTSCASPAVNRWRRWLLPVG